mgnify:CR=1 FL=1
MSTGPASPAAPQRGRPGRPPPRASGYPRPPPPWPGEKGAGAWMATSLARAPLLGAPALDGLRCGKASCVVGGCCCSSARCGELLDDLGHPPSIGLLLLHRRGGSTAAPPAGSGHSDDLSARLVMCNKMELMATISMTISVYILLETEELG